MHEDPLQELRHIRHHIEQICAEQGQTYLWLSLSRSIQALLAHWPSHAAMSILRRG